MARKKEEGLTDKNRSHIIQVTKQLFEERGIEKSSMDDVAKAASMSKSTIYVYFKSKEEIFNCIALESMRTLRDRIENEVHNEGIDFKSKYFGVCNALVNFKKEYPLYFEIIVQNIEVSEEAMEKQPILQELYKEGEEINQLIGDCFAKVIQNADNTAAIVRNVFLQWGSIYGLIVLADNKEAYIRKTMGYSKEEFLQRSFEQLYQLIENNETRDACVDEK